MFRVGHQRLFASLLLISALGFTACGDDPQTPDPQLTAIRVEPAALSLGVGETGQLTVLGDYDDGSTAALATGVSFDSSAPETATVAADGVVTGVAAGTAEITATSGAFSDSATVVVAAATVEGEVFVDDYAEGVSFADFGGATNLLSVDAAENASLKVEVPAAGYTGGALVAAAPWDLSGYNAVTFWVKGSKAATLNVVGLGNDGEGAAFSAELTDVPVTTEWVKHVLPLPDPEKAGAVSGLFHFAEGSDEGAYTLWFDDIRYESLPTSEVGAPSAAAIAWADLDVAPGATAPLASGDNTVTFDLPALTLTNVAFSWFDLFTSDDTVATVAPDGVVTGVTEGTADLTAALASLDVDGMATVTVAEIPQAPEVAAPAPTQDPADVLSLFSDAYTDVAVDTWRAPWEASQAVLTDLDLGGDAVKEYASLNHVGIEFIGEAGANLIDASGHDYLHLDVWTPNATSLEVKLVDFGADAAWGGGDDTEGSVFFTAGGAPDLATGQWVSLDIPLSAFASLTSRDHLAQLILAAEPAGSATIYVDNLYFYTVATPQAPTTAAPIPAHPQAEVVSLFSDAYDDVAVDGWWTDWSQAALTETDVNGDAVKQYSGLTFVGVEFINSGLVDASGMSFMHIDLWTPNATAFGVKLVDAGADGDFFVGDDNSEHELLFDATTSQALVQGEWVSLDIPLADFAGLAGRAHLAQLIFSADPDAAAVVFVDNVYFHN